MSDLIKKTFGLLKKEGINGIRNRIRPPKIDVIDFFEFVTRRETIPFSKDDYQKHCEDKQILINWIIPEIGVGSGGHINIFRFVSFLERHGCHNRIYIFRGNKFQDNEKLSVFLKEFFSILDNQVEAFYTTDEMKYAHAVIATSWDTAYFVKYFNNTISKFYFVQDFEPYFYPLGSEYQMAEATYHFGFRGITAGDWLKEKLKNEYQMKTESFGFSYDKNLYFPHDKKDTIPRVFFYARPVTPRRDFEIGLLALDLLKKKIPELEILFAGWKSDHYQIPFEVKDLGILSLEELSDVYGQCDLCLIMSNTNLSLLPVEVMASNSVVVSTKGKNNEWLVNDENAVIVSYDPVEIAEKMYWYLINPEALDTIRKKGLAFAQNTCWEKEGLKVKDAIEKGIQEDENS